MKIAVLDYEAGNLKSICKALAKLGADAKIIAPDADFAPFDALVIPGVGSFLLAKNITCARQRLAKFSATRPILGICLGMQVLFEKSEEAEGTGLGLFLGRVKRLEGKPGLKIPQIGWNRIELKGKCRLLEGISNGERLYFVHSYAVKGGKNASSTCDYGGTFVSSVEKGNIYGVQFHPEKSGKAGLKVLGNFLAIAGENKCK